MGDSARAAASLEDGSRMLRLTASARTRSRRRLPSPDQPVETDPARRAQRRGHVPVRQGANDADRLLLARDDRAALEQRLEAADPLAGPVRQVEQRALLDLPAFAIALAQSGC